MVTTFQQRPAGIIVLGILSVFVGIAKLLSPLNKPLVLGGVMYAERYAMILHILFSIGGIYVGYGLLKPVRHIWYFYIIMACASILSLELNLLHESKLWELYLSLSSPSESIPRLVKLTIETHYLLITIYALTAVYIYLQKAYFLGNDDV